MANLAEQIDKMIERRDEAYAAANDRIARAKARLRKRRRSDDTRRKVLVGAMHLDGIGRGKYSLEATLRDMAVFLIRPVDRELFGLPAPQPDDDDALEQTIKAAGGALLRKDDRAQDTRRKILIGAMLLQKVSRDVIPNSLLRIMMDRFLTKQVDRSLFDLPPPPDDSDSDQAS